MLKYAPRIRESRPLEVNRPNLRSAETNSGRLKSALFELLEEWQAETCFPNEIFEDVA
jgi:hypothetical protein